MSDNEITESLLIAGVLSGVLIGILIGMGITFFSFKSDILDQDKTIADLEAEAKSKPVITIEGLGICQVKQGGKVYMLVDITEEMQANQAVDEIGLEEKHNQLMESYEEPK